MSDLLLFLFLSKHMSILNPTDCSMCHTSTSVRDGSNGGMVEWNWWTKTCVWIGFYLWFDWSEGPSYLALRKSGKEVKAGSADMVFSSYMFDSSIKCLLLGILLKIYSSYDSSKDSQCWLSSSSICSNSSTKLSSVVKLNCVPYSSSI